MELLLLILVSTLISAFLLVSFYLGYQLGIEKEKEKTEAVFIDENNKDLVKGYADFLNFKG